MCNILLYIVLVPKSTRKRLTNIYVTRSLSIGIAHPKAEVVFKKEQKCHA